MQVSTGIVISVGRSFKSAWPEISDGLAHGVFSTLKEVRGNASVCLEMIAEKSGPILIPEEDALLL